MKLECECEFDQVTIAENMRSFVNVIETSLSVINQSLFMAPFEISIYLSATSNIAERNLVSSDSAT